MRLFKKNIALIFVAFIILSLFACRVKVRGLYNEAPMAIPETVSYTGANGFSRVAMKQMALNDYAAVEETAEYGESHEKKLIKTVDINAETKEFDNAIEWLKSYIDSFHGIIDSSYIDSGNKLDKNYRMSANFRVRVPADSLQSFLSKLGDKLNIVFQQENVRDVTDTYDDTESRKNTLYLELDKLNELLKKAKSVEDLISIESKLSEVRYEIQNIENSLKRMDKQIDYSTININITEVKDLTETIEKEDYSKDNLLKLLNKNFEETKKFALNSLVFIFTHIPAICLGLIILVIVLLIVLLIRSITGTKRKRKSVNRKKTINVVETESQTKKKVEKKNTTNK